ncbi:MAG: UDP-N-acetylglucosamine 1-carboxyvinyltransferase [Candidatus Sumerlaeota bacterium]
MDILRIQGGRPLEGTVEVGGSKNGALPVMAAAMLLDGPSTIENVPDLRDIRHMIQVLEHIGARIRFDNNVLEIDPSGFRDEEAPYDLVRKMRASVYVLGPLLARHGHARVSLPGGCAIGARPVDLHLKGMRALGTTVDLEHGFIEANAPEGGLQGGECLLIGESGSSVGATCNVLMAAVLAKGRSIINGAALEPEIADLIQFLNKAGAKIQGIDSHNIEVEGVANLQGVHHCVLPDRIEAGTFMAAAAITRGDLRIAGARVGHLQAEIEKLREIGSQVNCVDGGINVRHEGPFFPITLSTQPFPGFATDLQAQFMAILALGEGKSTLHETIFPDRFMHAAELNRMGADIDVRSPSAIVSGVEHLTGAHVMASDLRASAALVIAGLAAEGETIVHRIYHLDRGYERLEDKLRGLNAVIERDQE